MANIFIFIMNFVLALVVTVFAIAWFLPMYIARGLYAIYRKVLGLNT